MKEKKQILHYAVFLQTFLFLSSTTLIPLRLILGIWFGVMEEVYYVNPPWAFEIKYAFELFIENHKYLLIYRAPMATSHLLLSLLLTGLIIHPIKFQFINAFPLIVPIVILPFFYLFIIAKISLSTILPDYIFAIIILIIFYKINSLINQLKSNL